MVRVASQGVSLSLRDSAGAMELIPLALRWFLLGGGFGVSLRFGEVATGCGPVPDPLGVASTRVGAGDPASRVRCQHGALVRLTGG